MSSARLLLLGAGTALAMLSTPASAQQDDEVTSKAEFEAEAADAMAKSEARVKSWFADPGIQTLKARADGGDARAQVEFADRIRDNIINEAWSRNNIRQSMMRYYAMAMEQNHGPAFARIGKLAELVQYSGALRRSTRDLGEAFSYYEKGAAVGDRDAVDGYLRLALNPNFCSFCQDKDDLSFDSKKMIADGVIKNTDPYDEYIDRVYAIYRTEKRAAMAKARKFTATARLDPNDSAGHQLATALLSGVLVPQKAREQIYLEGKAVLGIRPTDQTPQWLLQPDLPEAERLLLDLSMRGDVRATRRLADLYLKGWQKSPSAPIASDPEKYLYHMTRAVEQGSMIAAYMAGVEMLRGNNIPVNLTRGGDYVSTAAAAGFGPAEELAGYIFRDGVGIERNPEVALKLFERAANNGQLKGAEEAEALYRAGYGSDIPAMRTSGAMAMAIKAKQIRELSPQMAELIRRAHWDKFK